MKNKIFKVAVIIIFSIVLTLFTGIKKSYCAFITQQAPIIGYWDSGYKTNDFPDDVEKKLEEQFLLKLKENFNYDGELQSQMKATAPITVIDKKGRIGGGYYYTIRIRRRRMQSNLKSY